MNQNFLGINKNLDNKAQFCLLKSECWDCGQIQIAQTGDDDLVHVFGDPTIMEMPSEIFPLHCTPLRNCDITFFIQCDF